MKQSVKTSAGWQPRFPTSSATVARFWCSSLERAEALEHSTGRFREVRYEALLERGPQELAAIFDWLELPADGSFCREAVDRCSIGKLKSGALGPAGFFRKGEAEAWRAEATAAQIRCIEFIAGETMKRKGYELVARHPLRKPLFLRLHDAVGPRLQRLLGGRLQAGIKLGRRLAKDWAPDGGAPDR